MPPKGSFRGGCRRSKRLRNGKVSGVVALLVLSNRDRVRESRTCSWNVALEAVVGGKNCGAECSETDTIGDAVRAPRDASDYGPDS